MTHEERNNTLNIVSDQIRDAVLNKDAHYTRGEAVVSATRYIYRLYDFYNVFGEKTINGLELAELLSHIC